MVQWGEIPQVSGFCKLALWPGMGISWCVACCVRPSDALRTPDNQNSKGSFFLSLCASSVCVRETHTNTRTQTHVHNPTHWALSSSCLHKHTNNTNTRTPMLSLSHTHTHAHAHTHGQPIHSEYRSGTPWMLPSSSTILGLWCLQRAQACLTMWDDVIRNEAKLYNQSFKQKH